MAKKDENKSCCAPANMGCCKVESVKTVNERGQTVLPKESKEIGKIHAGDKLAMDKYKEETE